VAQRYPKGGLLYYTDIVFPFPVGNTITATHRQYGHPRPCPCSCSDRE